jgi:glycogen debranching enzyme
VDHETRVLKHGDTFAIFDRYGDIDSRDDAEHGIYHDGTRYLSEAKLLVNGARPVLLSSSVRHDNVLLSVDTTNLNVYRDGLLAIPESALHVSRSIFLWHSTCHQRIQFTNYGAEPIDCWVELLFDADFVDIFEVRGVTRQRRGTRLPPEVGSGSLRFGYDGLDGIRRATVLTFVPLPEVIDEASARCRLQLAPGERQGIDLAITAETSAVIAHLSFDRAFEQAATAAAEKRARNCRIHTSNQSFNAWLDRSSADVQMMISETPEGPYPYAGVPWFSTIFGRDGIITALQLLWVNPEIARGVLCYLAAHQSAVTNAGQDAEPGKILHETRRGEMAELGEIPFKQYYGSVDATPLFVSLAGEYYTATGDLALIEAIWPNIEQALSWIDTYGDRDGDGFIEYERQAEHGLVQQGWKDSHDSIYHGDGSLAVGPIALVEIQGYVYSARRAAARLARLLGRQQTARALGKQAEALKAQFQRAFWSEELGTYALALDREKRPCLVRSSNAGHALFSRIADPNEAAQVAALLLNDQFFSGWGIRTIAAGETRYNPMAYHNGSVWPHDNALIAAGLGAYGYKEATIRILEGMFAASLQMDLHRLPELFCGFPREESERPTLYPVACAPQAWAAGSVFMLLGACLGLRVDVPRRQLHFSRPVLPPFLDEVEIRDVRVGTASLDLVLRRYPEDISVNVMRREGDVDVLVIK